MIGDRVEEDEDCKKFEKILEEANHETEPIEPAEKASPKKGSHPDTQHSRTVAVPNPKKVSLSSRNKNKNQPTNEAVLNFISDSTVKKNANNSTMTSTLENITDNKMKAHPTTQDVTPASKSGKSG